MSTFPVLVFVLVSVLSVLLAASNASDADYTVIDVSGVSWTLCHAASRDFG